MSRPRQETRLSCSVRGSVEPWPWAPELFRIERDVVEPRLEDAVLTGRDARDVLQEARDEARGIAIVVHAGFGTLQGAVFPQLERILDDVATAAGSKELSALLTRTDAVSDETTSALR